MLLGKALNSMAQKLIFFVRICILYSSSAARHEDYVGVQIEMEVEIHNFQQHTKVRWLSRGPSIKRVLEQWDAIIKFVSELAKD